MGRCFPALLALCLLLTGCAPLLERSYTTSEPHSSKYWESEAADTLRAENDQDIVNDLLILIGQAHGKAPPCGCTTFRMTRRLAMPMEKASLEVQQDTPLGAYAAEYITYVSQPQRSYYEVNVQIGYRRSESRFRPLSTLPAFLR